MIELNQNKSFEVWALLDEKAGHNSQTLGVIEALGLPYRKKKIFFNGKAKLPNFLKFKPLNTIDESKSDILSKPWPDIVISCGRRLAPINLEVKKRAAKAGKKVLSVHIMWPGYKPYNFDLLAIPTHDRILWPFKNSSNILRIIGAPNRINKDFLLQEYRIWSRTIGELPSPKIAVLIGGSSKKGTISISHAKKLVDSLVKMTSGLKASLLVSNSRRTPAYISEYIEENLRKKIGKSFYFHDVSKNIANPYFAYLQLSDMIIVTGDSISMCSEAASTGKPVFIFSPDGLVPEKHKNFQNNIITAGYAHNFNEENVKDIAIGNFILNRKQPVLNTAEIIAENILQNLEGGN